jgi:hypothetical protein
MVIESSFYENTAEETDLKSVRRLFAMRFEHPSQPR